MQHVRAVEFFILSMSGRKGVPAVSRPMAPALEVLVSEMPVVPNRSIHKSRRHLSSFNSTAIALLFSASFLEPSLTRSEVQIAVQQANKEKQTEHHSGDLFEIPCENPIENPENPLGHGGMGVEACTHVE